MTFPCSLNSFNFGKLSLLLISKRLEYKIKHQNTNLVKCYNKIQKRSR